MSKELSRVKSRQTKMKASRRSSTISSENIAAQPDGFSRDGEVIPSRTQTYTSERVRLSKLFVNSLILIFVILLGSLLLWGLNGAPELGTILW